jgi:NitT/TauT family transport system substrate-binding protein
MISRSALLAGLAAFPAAVAPARAQTPGMPVTVSVSDISASKVPYIVAAESGIYARNGLDVTQFITPLAAEIARGNGVTVPPENIRSGLEPEISTGGGSPVVVTETSIATAAPRVILATTDSNGAFFHLYARPSIKRVADLKGKRIGYIIRGSVDDLLLNALARRLGWDPAKDWSMFSGVVRRASCGEDEHGRVRERSACGARGSAPRLCGPG